MFGGIHYIISRNDALKATQGIKYPDLIVLHTLFNANAPCSYGQLHHLVTLPGCSMNQRMFVKSLHYCVANRYITKVYINAKSTQYTITLSGRSILEEFNHNLESIVKAKIMRYGNGL